MLQCLLQTIFGTVKFLPKNQLASIQKQRQLKVILIIVASCKAFLCSSYKCNCSQLGSQLSFHIFQSNNSSQSILYSNAQQHPYHNYRQLLVIPTILHDYNMKGKFVQHLHNLCGMFWWVIQIPSQIATSCSKSPVAILFS